MWRPNYYNWKAADVEAGPGGLYPMMLESPGLRWALIRKVYTNLCFQLFLTIAVASVVVSVPPIRNFFVSGEGLGLYIFILLIPFMVICPMYYYYQSYPCNFILLGVFTVSLSFAVGLTCAFTPVVVVSLTLYTFWAARRGYDFNFLGIFLFSAIIVLMVYALIQILFPLGRFSLAIWAAVAAIVFSGYIIYDTDNLIKRYTYDEYIWAAVSLYLDIINLFLAILTIFRVVDA
ncbi:protein LIFEGUARD 4-like [Tasmannia lanceolata]|uniref:protein LIFEGUARD 4-like n=1 Tax=Tasmannia lanceolata TaxID=3420 RepID=UPI0040646414